VQVVQAVRAEHLEAMPLAVGIAKVVFSGLIGWSAALLLIVPGGAMIKSA
jgi:hypothetical protein